jgi:mRNA interferase RelE/StbE
LPVARSLGIGKVIDGLASNPRPRGCQKLKGYKDFWRIRIGDYRVVYLVADTIRLVRIERVADRKDAYR